MIPAGSREFTQTVMGTIKCPHPCNRRTGLVKAAYSSGNPAIGVGPETYLFLSMKVQISLCSFIDHKIETFDNGTICASEQSVIIEEK